MPGTVGTLPARKVGHSPITGLPNVARPSTANCVETIEFLRANRADAFPPPAAPAGKLAAAWSRYCTWTPLLRVGAFVLAYLIVWAVFLTVQLTGRRAPRAVWVCAARCGHRAFGIVSSIQSSTCRGGRDRGRGRATRSWVRLRCGLRATAAQSHRVHLDGDSPRMDPRRGCPTTQKGGCGTQNA